MPVPRGPISSKGLFRLKDILLISSTAFVLKRPYCQVNQMLVSCRVNGRHKKVMIVVEIFNLCVLYDVVPVLPLATCFEVEDKLEDQSLSTFMLSENYCLCCQASKKMPCSPQLEAVRQTFHSVTSVEGSLVSFQISPVAHSLVG